MFGDAARDLPAGFTGGGLTDAFRQGCDFPGSLYFPRPGRARHDIPGCRGGEDSQRLSRERREVTEDYLIPTDLRLEAPAGFKLGTISYPKGTLKTFSFSKNKQLNVYTDEVVIRVPLTALATAPLGPQHLPMKLHYQACSNEICLPPVTKDVDPAINVVASKSEARTANAQFFK